MLQNCKRFYEVVGDSMKQGIFGNWIKFYKIVAYSIKLFNNSMKLEAILCNLEFGGNSMKMEEILWNQSKCSRIPGDSMMLSKILWNKAYSEIE